MDIHAKITGIEYKPLLGAVLSIHNFEGFDINQAPGACCLRLHETQSILAISKWVSPKRTRSYPYERVYDTLAYPKKITVIPVVKDEGIGGDRDFVQWDTVSLMRLLDVYVILAYYHTAERHLRRRDKITRQQLDAVYVNQKISDSPKSQANSIFNFTTARSPCQSVFFSNSGYSK